MRIFAVSDWRIQSIDALHTHLQGRDDIDLFAYAGDDLSRFYDQKTNHLSELARETSLGDAIVVRGNDDLPGLSNTVFDADNVHNVHSHPYRVNGVTFIGQEGSTSGPGHILYNEADVRQNIEQDLREATPSDQVCLISHSPPHGTLDIAQRHGQDHVGSTAISGLLEQYEPELLICGHCHQMGGRVSSCSNTTVVNIASHDDQNADARYAIIDIDSESILVETDLLQTNSSDPLLKLIQVGESRAESLRENGISTLEDINQSNRPLLTDVPGAGAWHADRWIAQANSILSEEVNVFDPSAFSFLNSDPLLLLDLETDLSQSRIWLAGFYDASTGEITQFFDPDNEEQLLTEICDHVTGYTNPNIVYYGGNRFDEKCLESSLNTHDLPSLQGQSQYRDLGLITQQELFGNVSGYKVGELASNVSDWASNSDLDGFEVGRLYTQYLLDGIEPDWNELKEYNKEDLQALSAIVEFIQQQI